MKRSLSLKLAVLIAVTMVISSLMTIFLVNTLTARRFSSYALQRDLDLAQAMADSLTRAAVEGSLEETLRSFSSTPMRLENGLFRNSGIGSHRGMMGRMRNEGPFVPLTVTDTSGNLLAGTSPGPPEGPLLKTEFDQERGIPFYSQNSIAGYVFAGSMLEGGLPANEREYLKNLLRGVLLSSLLAALIASVTGFLILKRILKPLKSLHKAVLQLGRGEYSHRVESSGSRDEIGILAESFNDMARSLEASEQWKKQIISDTAHELRTPVSLIMGTLEMMLEGVYQADEKRLRSLYNESSLLAELIKDLQVLANAESISAGMEHEEFDPDELIRISAEGFQPVAREKNICLSTESRGNGFITGDRRKIHQVIKNLLSNALRYTPVDGAITLRTYRKDFSCIMEVEDTGPGIPEDERLRIFDRFYRIDKSRNREDGGAGLGLAISKAIIKMHKGEISVLAGAEGGALFRVILPVSQQEIQLSGK